MPRTKVSVVCCVKGCSARPRPGLTFHKFPQDDDEYMVKIYHPEGRMEKVRRRQVWKDRLQFFKEITSYHRVCGEHFASSDFVPTYLKKARCLKKTAIPSRKLPNMGAIDTTVLPDGTECVFFSMDSDKETSSTKLPSASEPSSSSNDSSSTMSIADSTTRETQSLNGDPQTRKTRLASQDPLAKLDGLKSSMKSQSAVSVDEHEKPFGKCVDIFDFDGIVDVAAQNGFKLPGSHWSYTQVGRSVFMFLCWSTDLKLTKKAVVRRGSKMIELYCDDELLTIDPSVDLYYYRDLELALSLLDKYERCDGFGDGKRSQDCAWFTLSLDKDESVCEACHRQRLAALSTSKPFGVLHRIPKLQTKSEASHEGSTGTTGTIKELSDRKRLAPGLKYVAKKSTGGRFRSPALIIDIQSMATLSPEDSPADKEILPIDDKLDGD